MEDKKKVYFRLIDNSIKSSENEDNDETENKKQNETNNLKEEESKKIKKKNNQQNQSDNIEDNNTIFSYLSYFQSNLHHSISKNITDILDKYHYQPISIKTNKNIKDIFFYHDEFVFKPDYLNYLQFYNLFCLSYYWSNYKYLLTNIYLHTFYICHLLEDQISKKYNYSTIYDKKTLKNISFVLFHYIIFFKLKLNPTFSFLSKSMFYGSISTFQALMNINNAYQKRLDNLLNTTKKENNLIENNQDNDFLSNHVLVFTSDINLIKDIVNYTRHFTFSNYLFFISLLLLLF